MLPGNSSHPSLYPELDSVPFLYRPFWDRVYGTILVTLSLFLLALIRLRRRLGQNDPFRAKRSRGTKKQRTAWDAVGEEKQRDFTIRKITSLFVSDPLRRLPTRKVFCTVWLLSCKGPIPPSKHDTHPVSNATSNWSEGVMVVMSLIIFRQSKITNSQASFEPMTSHQPWVGECFICWATEQAHGEEHHWAHIWHASSATFRKIVFVLNLMLRCDLLTCHFVTVFWQMTKPQSFSVLLQLPFRQLESVFEVSTKCDLSGNIFHKVFRFLRWVHANYIMNWSSPIGAFLVNI